MKIHRLHILALHNPGDPITGRLVKTVEAEAKKNPQFISVVNFASAASLDKIRHGREAMLDELIAFAKEKINDQLNQIALAKQLKQSAPQKLESKENDDLKFEVNFDVDFNAGHSKFNINSIYYIHDGLSKEYPNVSLNYTLIGSGGSPLDEPTTLLPGTVESISNDRKVDLVDKMMLAKGKYNEAFKNMLKARARRPSELMLGSLFSPRAGNPSDLLSSPSATPLSAMSVFSPTGSESSVTSSEGCLSPQAFSPLTSPVATPTGSQ